MRNIIVFIDEQDPKVVRKHGNSSRIFYLYPDGKPRALTVHTTFATFINGQSGAICFAADRPVSHNELLQAHDELLGKS